MCPNPAIQTQVPSGTRLLHITKGKSKWLFFRNVQYVIKIKIKKFKKFKNLSSNKEDQPTTGFNH